ncbi:MFS transporter [Cobetia sp. 1CM21F]|uniref:MFS transporter n=1 Tax=Cobetia sp. 1CM21F TaxID=2929163 RepID=UPI0020C070FC|nr:MFS transporter [Cobetia sp. 1CM21F]MCK8067693.1 MFS transporter [Cobetia sp. 1CM21F]
MADTQLLTTQPRLHYAWVVALVGGIAVFCGLGLGRFAFGMMLPSMSASLELSYGQGGMLGFGNMVGYLVAVTLVPLLLARLGTRATATLGLIVMALSMFGMVVVIDFTALCFFYFLTGFGSGAVVLPSMSVMSKWFAPSHRGLSSGIVMAGPGFGIILSGFAVPNLVPFHGIMSWQTGWLIFGAITAFVALLAFAFIRNHPSDVGHAPYGRTAAGIGRDTAALTRQGKLKLLAHMGLIFGIYGATYMLYVTFIVTSMVDSYGMSEAKAGSLWSLFGFLSIFSGVLFGGMSDRIGRRAGMAVAFAALGLSFFLVGFGSWTIGLYISIVLFGLAAWSIPVIISAAAGDYFGSSAAATALAALMVGFSVGQAAGPVVAGFLAERSGDFASSYATSSGAALVSLGLIFFLRPPRTAE